jgi:CheY-like chemotaxis protein
MAIPSSYKSVVVVDDEPAVLQLLAEVVRRAGYVPQPASSAEEAMELLGEVASETCLVISDVVMDGMDGRELATWIRAEHPELPVLLVSGYMFDHEGQPLPPGVTFRRKPLSVVAIHELVEDSCGID